MLWKQQGWIQGPQHPSCTQDQLLSPSLQLESTGHGRPILVALGCPCLSLLQSHLPWGLVGSPCPPLRVLCTGCFLARGSLGRETICRTLATTLRAKSSHPTTHHWHSLISSGHHTSGKEFCTSTKTSSTLCTATAHPTPVGGGTQRQATQGPL